MGEGGMVLQRESKGERDIKMSSKGVSSSSSAQGIP